jgi:hypothetical protein
MVPDVMGGQPVAANRSRNPQRSSRAMPGWWIKCVDM